MAVGHARCTGGLGVCVSPQGPGAGAARQPFPEGEATLGSFRAGPAQASAVPED
jgi:hypothetical protein